MDLMTGDISNLIFRRIMREHSAALSFDGQILNVLSELDGQKNVTEVAKKTGINLGKMRGILSSFLQLNLIEPVNADSLMLDRDFYDYLKGQLSLAVGPIAEILIEEGVERMGCAFFEVPKYLSAELVDILAREIPVERRLIEFKQNMVKKIKEGGYVFH